MYNTTYGVCCPAGFNVIAPYYTANAARPFSGAGCLSLVGAYQPYIITSYDTSTLSATVTTVAPTSGTFVNANAFDGIITGVPPATSTTSTSTSTTTSSTSCSAGCATPAATVSVTFEIQYAVAQEGESIHVYGSVPALGSWVVNDSVPLLDAYYTNLYPLWEVPVPLAAGTLIQYKYLHYLPDGTYNTTSGANYTLTVAQGCSATQTVSDTWR